ncbi:hypothetical protein BGZ96_010837 [Linnemannia gamsii]|uniref:NACHT domain-containing protein n=1 Tax=Linnemannia gamsii TaxID=64522 RepID=A0ABQ7JUB3_9FUNG|nr:hypothetical protein BGZ96_010837 [Linnemannia gamsii]
MATSLTPQDAIKIATDLLANARAEHNTSSQQSLCAQISTTFSKVDPATMEELHQSDSTESIELCDEIDSILAEMGQLMKKRRQLDQDNNTNNPAPKRLNMIADIEQEFLRIRGDRMASYRQLVFIPPYAKPDARAQDKDVFPLTDKVKEFLASEREVMLILGDSGAGKSTFLCHLEYDLWEHFETGGSIPLFVSLPAIQEPDKDLILKQLENLDVSMQHIQALKRDRRQFVVICDGYDESQLVKNLHTANKFNRPGQWMAKLIVTCRSQYLSQGYRDLFVPQDLSHYSRPALHLFQQAAIAPFTNKQITNYIDIYVPLEPRNWTTNDYMDKLTTIPNLMDLVKSPFLLTLALEALPGVTKGRQDLSFTKITRVQLYDAFVKYWLSVNKRRLQCSTLSAIDRSTLDHIKEAGFVTEGIKYCANLALAIFEQQDGNPVVNYVHLKDKASWRVEFFGPDPVVRILRESSPLTRTGSQFRFMHRSMLEYFFSRAIFNPSTHENDDEFAPQPDIDSSNAQPLDPHGPLFTQNLLTEPSVLQFLYERVQQDLVFKEQLLAVVERSKTDDGYSRAAANAMTILVKAKVRFNGADLRSIKIPGANLFGGQFDSAQFQGADLTNANFTRTWIRQADFSSAVMNGVNFGDIPPIKETSPIYCCTFSPDGTILVAGLKDGNMVCYNTSTWERADTLLGHTRRVTSIAFSPSGTCFVSGSRDSTVRLWDPRTGQLIRTFEGHDGRVVDVAFSPSGHRIASASKAGTVRIWDTESGTTKLVFRDDYEEAVTSISWSPDGRRILSRNEDGFTLLWETENGAKAIDPDYDWLDQGIEATMQSGKVNFMPCPDREKIALLRSTLSVDILWTMRTMCPGVHNLVFSPNGRWMASSSDADVILWDTETFTQIISWSNLSYFVKGVAFSPDNLQIVSCGSDRTIHRIDLSTVDKTLEMQGDFLHDYFQPYSILEYSTDGGHILSKDPRGIFRWDSQTGASEQLASHKEVQVRNIVFSPSGTQFAECRFADIQLRDIATGSTISISTGHSENISCLAYSPNGTWIASGSYDNTVQLWNLLDDTTGPTLLGHTDHVKAVAFSPNGRQVASGSDDETVRLWDAHTGELTAVITGHAGPFGVLTYAPDGSMIASHSIIGGPRLWDIHTGASLGRFSNIDVTLLSFSPCSQWIALNGQDLSGQYLSNGRYHSIYIQQTGLLGERSRMSYELPDFMGDIVSVVWNPSKKDHFDHLEFATGCKDQSIRVWRMSVEDEEVRVSLVWSSDIVKMLSTNAKITEAVGLSNYDRKYLIKCGATDSSFQDDSEESSEEYEYYDPDRTSDTGSEGDEWAYFESWRNID